MILKQLLQSNSLSFLWTGNDGWLIHYKDILVAFDLDLFNHERINKCSLDLSLLCQKLDLIMITHEHEDHFNSETCKMLLSNSQCKFVIPKSCAKKAADIGIRHDRLILVEPLQIHSIDGITIECIRAIHGHVNGSVYSGATPFDCGYIISLADKKIYQPGDTLLLEEHFSMTDIDILMVSPTEHNTAIDDTILLIDSINPSYILPQHHSTYVESNDNKFWSHGYVDEVFARLDNSQKKQFVKLTQEDIFEIDFK